MNRSPRRTNRAARKTRGTASQAAGQQQALEPARRRLSQRRGDDMGLAALDAELKADGQRSRDDVHERDNSGT